MRNSLAIGRPTYQATVYRRQSPSTFVGSFKLEAHDIGVWGSTSSPPLSKSLVGAEAAMSWDAALDVGAGSAVVTKRGDWTSFERDAIYKTWETLLEEPRTIPSSHIVPMVGHGNKRARRTKRARVLTYWSVDFFSPASLDTQASTATSVSSVLTATEPIAVDRRFNSQSEAKVHKITLLGHPVLRQRAAPVPVVDAEVRQLVNDLFETMYEFEGVGLAANQVGIAKRVAVVDIGESGSQPLVLINPRIVRSSDEADTEEEGCLSIPDIFADVERPFSVTIEALDYFGRPFKLATSGYEARAIQHEIDHLDGIVFLDRLSAVRRSLLMGKWKKSRKRAVGYTREPPGDP